ncbi:SGNH/GDSL hydrolase family protein [Virgifigura deserti]|uniref:SGNH/GDSL hydrolase family protein n=1 Tax=Virgifigura deserti TaxID=2268457 RepID=UPI003CCC0AF0
MRGFNVFIALLVGMALTISTKAAAAPAFDRLVVFGDSLSDNGNAGRFSNGPVWVEHLAERLALALEPARIGGGNFAVGGARLDPRSGIYSLRAQADLFFGMPQPNGRTLHIVFGGGNDLLAAVGSSDARAMVDAAVMSLKSILADLVARGATDILVPNLPDVGMTPAMRARGSGAMVEAAHLTDRFNAAVERALTDIAAAPDLRLYRLDLHALAERARSDPATFGFVDVTTPCNGLASCEGHLFWDDIHPTTEAHCRLAEAALRMLKGEGLLP